MPLEPLMDLRGPVPSEGAHRMAWVIGTAPNPARKLAELEDVIGPNKTQRLLSGVLTPGERMGAQIWAWSGGRIETCHFYWRTDRKWWQRPASTGSSTAGWRMPMPGRSAQRGDAVARRQRAQAALDAVTRAQANG